MPHRKTNLNYARDRRNPRLRTAKRAGKLQGSPTIEAAEKVRKLLAEKIDVVRFDVGEPDFDTPEHIRQAGIEAIRQGFTHYTSARGIPELRQALVEDQKEKGLADLTTSNVVFYPGSKIALFSILSLLLDPGDEAIIQDPLWPTYASIIEYLGAKPVRIKDWDDEDPSGSFDVQAFSSRISSKTRAVLINSPTNPTGAEVKGSKIEELLKICDGKGVPLVLDRIYSSLSYADDHADRIPSCCDLESGNIVIVSGFSKEFAMTGWRLGYTVSSKAFTDLLVNFQENTTTCAPSFVQKAAVAALTAPRDWQRKMNSEYKERRDIMTSEINKIPGWRCTTPAGAFYCFPKINKTDSVDFSARLLEKKHVSCVAGAYFGPSGESHIRLSYTTPKNRILEGMKRIGEFVVSEET